MPNRTVADFIANGLEVSIACRVCGHTATLSLDVLDATFGSDFDLVASQREIANQLYCPACGAPRPVVHLIKSSSEVPSDAAATPQPRRA